MITSASELKKIVDKVESGSAVALDTEFVWERTYYPILGLIQLALSPDESYLIDAPAIDDLSSLGELISRPDVVKILHDAKQDLIILQRECGGSPCNIFDTQPGAGFLGESSCISLQKMLEFTVNVTLPKTESRTNWLQRPLTQKQLDYAIDDVCHMHKARETYIEMLSEKKRYDWLLEEMSIYDDQEIYKPVSTMLVYKKIKGYGRLRQKQMCVLRELASWRENQAIAKDLPKGRIIDDSTILNLSRNMPDTPKKAEKILSKGKRCQAKPDEVVTEIKKALQIPQENWPKLPKVPDNVNLITARTDFSFSFVKGFCQKHGIDPQLVSSRAEIESFVMHLDNPKPEKHRILRGWRYEFVGAKLQSILRGESSVVIDSETGLPSVKEIS